jgi:outer membrane immunogenic protein
MGIHANVQRYHRAWRLGGLQIGVNYQLPFWHLVAGLEVDNSAVNVTGHTAINSAFPSGAPYLIDFGTRISNSGTARMRFGYAWGRFLPYFTAGFTYGVIGTSYTFSTPGFFSSVANTSVRSGVFPHVGCVGIGAEYAIDSHFTVKVDYLYEFINARRLYITPGDGTTISYGTRTMYHIGRIGLNYKFDWLSPAAAPTVAK